MTGRFHVAPTYFRDATHADHGALARISQKTIAAYVVDNLERNYCPMMLLDRQPVGFAVCRDDVLDLIVIDYMYHRQGLGSKLLAHCETEMFTAYPAIALQCFEHNDQANQFFQKHHWRRTVTFRDDRSGVRTILYQKLFSDTRK